LYRAYKLYFYIMFLTWHGISNLIVIEKHFWKT
jgi:hypothetical protein